MKLKPGYLFIILFLSLYAKAAPHTGKDKGMVPGKIYFSNTPILTSNAGSKISFSSAENIYARRELNSTTIRDAFRIKEPGKDLPFIQFRVTIRGSDNF